MAHLSIMTQMSKQKRNNLVQQQQQYLDRILKLQLKTSQN